MRAIVIDQVTWSVGLFVCQSVCHTSKPCKTAELIEILFGLRTQVGPGNHHPRIRWGSRSPWKGAIFVGKGCPIVKYGDTAVICAKMAEPIKIPLGLWARISQRNHVLRNVLRC